MRLGIRSEVFNPAEDHTWLGSRHGTDNGDPITLDGDLMLAAFPSGLVPSGVVVAKVTATGRYAFYTDAGTHGAGTDTARYHLLTTKQVFAGEHTPAAGFWHGEVVEAKLPAGHGLTAAAKADLTQVRYV